MLIFVLCDNFKAENFADVFCLDCHKNSCVKLDAFSSKMMFKSKSIDTNQPEHKTQNAVFKSKSVNTN